MPRVISDIFIHTQALKITDLDRKCKILKLEWQVRFVTLVLYFMISFISSVHLPAEFCQLFDGVFTSKRTADETTTCIWQIFGIRMIGMLAALPLEIILHAVIVRHSKDLTFQLGMKRYIKAGDEEEFLRIQLNSLAFRMNNEDDTDSRLGNNDPQKVREAINRIKMRNLMSLEDTELADLQRLTGYDGNGQIRVERQRVVPDELMTNNSAMMNNSDMKMLGHQNAPVPDQPPA